MDLIVRAIFSPLAKTLLLRRLLLKATRLQRKRCFTWTLITINALSAHNESVKVFNSCLWAERLWLLLFMEDYIVVKALEDGVNIIGLTSGRDTKFHHTEKLDKGEVFLAQFTDVTTAIKINGAAEIYTKHGKVLSDER